jgi:surfeit locus 1 family protein
MLGFRPRLWPTLITLPSVLLMLGLGTWQLERLAWKQNLIAERTSGLAAPVALWPDVRDRLADQLWKRVRVEGQFLHDQEMLLAARSLNGNLGFHVVTPFRVAGDGVVLVDRGWIPLDRREPSRRAEGQIPGEIDVTAVVRPGHRAGWFTPDNHPADKLWYWLDLPAMAAAAGLAQEAVTDVYLEADATANPGGFPIGGQTRINLPNDHLQYAITWYALAVALAVIYIAWHRRPNP